MIQTDCSGYWRHNMHSRDSPAQTHGWRRYTESSCSIASETNQAWSCNNSTEHLRWTYYSKTEDGGKRGSAQREERHPLDCPWTLRIRRDCMEWVDRYKSDTQQGPHGRRLDSWSREAQGSRKLLLLALILKDGHRNNRGNFIMGPGQFNQPAGNFRKGVPVSNMTAIGNEREQIWEGGWKKEHNNDSNLIISTWIR